MQLHHVFQLTSIFNQYIIFLFCMIYAQQYSHVHTLSNESTPVVLWHGMGDSCCFSFSLGRIKNILEGEIKDVYVKSIKIGEDTVEDVENSYFMDVNDQVKEACRILANDDKLKNGYNAIGFSQGAQFLRAVAQRCPNPQMKKLISLGGQHQGVYGFPNCSPNNHLMCDYLRKILSYGAYIKLIQNQLVQAEYWHDPMREHEYRTKSIFLADINNELEINEIYKENLQRLETLVLVKFENDTMVQPRETEWFGFYKPGQSIELQTLQQSDLYREDRLGLNKMDKEGKIHFLSVKANHLQFTDRWFNQTIIQEYLM